MRARGLKLTTFLSVKNPRPSRPMRARGLKQNSGLTKASRYSVSRPMRARGLKRRLRAVYNYITRSRPMRARGLKLTVWDTGNHN